MRRCDAALRWLGLLLYTKFEIIRPRPEKGRARELAPVVVGATTARSTYPSKWRWRCRGAVGRAWLGEGPLEGVKRGEVS